MKKCILALLLCLTLAYGACAAEESAPLDAAHFPDAVFRAYLAQTFDRDGDGFLNEEERRDVRALFVQEKGIRSLEGVGYFPLLESLACWGNELTELDLRGNPAVRDIACGGNQLRSLDVSGCPLLEDLSCYDNQLAFLDVSRNPALRYLTCRGNPLTGLKLNGNQKLIMLQADPIPGDVNGDFSVDGRDALRLARHLAGHGIEIDGAAADLNGDGRVDGRDLLRLAKRLAGN